jgi:hypothetical protein
MADELDVLSKQLSVNYFERVEHKRMRNTKKACTRMAGTQREISNRHLA